MAATISTFLALASFLLCVFGGFSLPEKGHHNLGTRSDDVNTLELAQAQLASDFQALQAKLTALETKVAQLSTPLAFTGETGSDQHYDNGATLKFGRILLNDGNMYDTHSGVVTVPQDGLYLVYVRSDPGNLALNHITLDLNVNGQHQLYAYGEHGSTGSVSAALRLRTGDRIWVTKRNDCTELWENAYDRGKYDDIYFIEPVSAAAPFQVYCQVGAGEGITYPMFRPHTTDYNRPYTECTDGVGDLVNWHYFLGLEALHQITTQGGYELQVAFQYQNPGTLTGIAMYDNFTVMSEAKKYEVRYSGFRATATEQAEDGFSAAKPVLFSAVGSDTNGCAALHGAPGWYGSDCSTNNGLFQTVPKWPVPTGNLVDLTEVIFMLIRKTPLVG